MGNLVDVARLYNPLPDALSLFSQPQARPDESIIAEAKMVILTLLLFFQSNSVLVHCDAGGILSRSVLKRLAIQ